jgi:hypothetical protein
MMRAATESARAVSLVMRVLSALGLNPTDLRLALVDAGEGHAGSVVDRAVLLCYGFDPAPASTRCPFTACWHASRCSAQACWQARSA